MRTHTHGLQHEGHPGESIKPKGALFTNVNTYEVGFSSSESVALANISVPKRG